MPKPRGWTKAQAAKRDEIAEAMLREGAKPGLAYGTATNRVKARRAAGKPARKAKRQA